MAHWRREWLTTSGFLPWEPHEQYENNIALCVCVCVCVCVCICNIYIYMYIIYIYTCIHCSFIYLSMHFWVASIFWLLWMILLWSWVYKYPFEILLSVLWGTYQEVELMHNMVILFLTLWGNTILFSTLAPFHISTSISKVFHFLCNLAHSCYFLVLFLYFDSSHLKGCEVVFHYGFDLHLK